MSAQTDIATDLTRILGAKSDLKTSIEGKGVTVPSATKIDGYAALVDQIPQGGGGGGCTPYDEQYFTIEAEASGTLSLYNVGTLSISTDGGTTWTDYTAEQISLSVTNGDILLFKRTMADGDYTKFDAAWSFKAYGNAMSLIYGDNFIGQTTIPYDSALLELFYQSGITDASNLILPATTLADYCYSNMFYGCTSLTAAPALPATTLAVRCYNNMFRGCTALVISPLLAAPTITGSAYIYLFRDCSSLKYIVCLATGGLSGNTGNWVSGVSGTGVFIKDSSASWDTGTSGIPSGWTTASE